MAATRQDLTPYLDHMDAALADGEAELTLDLGGYRDVTQARLWRGQVLVDWERDDSAGGCLLRPALVRRLMDLGASAEIERNGTVRLRAKPAVLRSLSEQHAQLAGRFDQPTELRVTLRFEGSEGVYKGGEEAYVVNTARRGTVDTPLLRLTASVRPRTIAGVLPTP